MKLFGSKTKKNKKRGSKAFVKSEQRAKHDWVFALVIFSLSIFLFVGANVYLYLGVELNENDLSEVRGESTKGIIDQDLLNSTIDFYTEKQKAFDSYSSAPPTVPSI